MASDVVVYLVVHQPRRLRLPAQPIPRGASAEQIEHALFDEPLNERYFRKVARRCYWPATELFAEMVERGFKLNVGFSFSFLRQAQMWDPDLLALYRGLVAHPGVESIGVEPYHSFLFLVDLPRFVGRMHWMKNALGQMFGRCPRVTDTTELCMSDGIAAALEHGEFTAGFIDGRPSVLGWREPSYLYETGRGLRLLARHHRLSDDVGYRFSNWGWSEWPLLAETYADWLIGARGDLVVLGWDYETFGEHHGRETGIFDFARRLPEEVARRGGRFLTASEAIEAHAERSHHLPLPAFPTSWAGSGGLDFFLGNAAQQAVFQLMLVAYNTALMTRDQSLIDLALWLMQSDHLHLIQWFGRQGPEAEVSAYFTPREWWDLGRGRVVQEIEQVYANFAHALDPTSASRRNVERLVQDPVLMDAPP